MIMAFAAIAWAAPSVRCDAEGLEKGRQALATVGVDQQPALAAAAIAEACRMAEQRAVHGGANAATLQVVEVEDLPLAYLPGNSLRVRVRVVGYIADGGALREDR